MDSSSLTDSNPEVELTSSDRLFYDRYQYSLRFRLDEFHCIRPWHDYDGNNVEELLEKIEQYRRRHHLRCNREIQYNNNWTKPKYYKAFEKTNREFQQQLERDLYPIVRLLWPVRADIKVVATTHWGYVYSDRLDLLKSIADMQAVCRPVIQQVVIDRPLNTIGLRNKQHNYRTYLRDLRVTESQRDQIQQYLAQQQDVRLCPSLKSWSQVDRAYPWLKNVAWSRSTFFFDHQGAADALMLEMMVPGIVRKTLEIVEVNNSTNYTLGN
jgi:hypothetical protein